MTVTDRSDSSGTPPEQDHVGERADTVPPPRDKPRLEPLDDLVLDDDAPAETVEVSAAALDPMREKEPSRPSKKERTRPKITLRIPDDEVARPEPARPEVPRPEHKSEPAPPLPSAAAEPRAERITRPDPGEVAPDAAPVAAAHQRTSPLPPKVDTEEIEIAIPSTPFVNVEPDPEPVVAASSTPPTPAGDSKEFESLTEGPFAPEADEDSWTPWQPTAVEQRESAAARSLASEAEVEELSPSDDGELISVEDDDKSPPSNPPEIEVDEVLVEEEPVALPPVRPRAASAPAIPPMRPPLNTPTAIGMDPVGDVTSAPSGQPSVASVPAPAPPAPIAPVAPPPVHSAPQLHQVLAEGGPRVGSTGTAQVPAEPKSEAKKRGKPWWEELFNDDYLRTTGTITDAEIVADANFIEDSLGVAKGATVLDLACGTGRHAIELGRRGYQVVGFDLSLSMLARASDEAQERGQKINFVQGDMREMTFEDAFDGVYCWQTSFGFFEEEKNAAVIGRVHRALRKGGQFLLDVVNRDYVAREAPSLVWFEGDGCICMDEMQMDFITSRLRIKRTMMIDDGRSKEIEYSVRAYSLHELGKLLHDAGFRVAEVTGKLQTPGVFFGCESPRIMILAEKR